MKLVFTPEWFLSADVLIEVFSFLVLGIFCFLSCRYYKISRKKNFLYLGFGFLLIAVAQLAVILTKIILYYDTTFIQQVGQFIVTSHVVNSIDIFYYIGFFFQKFLTLAGFYIIYRLPKRNFGDVLLAIYFLIISAVFSVKAEYVYHITVLVLLVLIIRNYYQVYLKNKSVNTKILIAAFVILALGHIVGLLSKMQVFYAVSNVIELISYVILLGLIIKIVKIKKTLMSKPHTKVWGMEFFGCSRN